MEHDPAAPRPGGVERRLHHRVDVQLSVTSLLGNALTGLTRFSTVTLNLSEGGAKIRVPEELLLAEALRLVLHFPDGSTHECAARVVRSSPYPDEEGEGGAWAALQFVELPEQTRAAIAGMAAPGGGG